MPFDATMIQLIPEDIILKMSNEQRLTVKKLCNASSIFKLIGEALQSKNAQQILFHARNKSLEIPMCKCGTALTWHADLKEYRKYCGTKCSAKYTAQMRKENNLKLFGYEWHSQNPDWWRKTQETIFQRYGENYYADRSKEISSTNLEKYGVTHPMQLDSVKEKVKSANLEKYGVENILSSPEIQQRIKETNLRKYGVANPSQNKTIKEKAISTQKNNYYDPKVLEKLNNKEWLSEEQKQKTIGEMSIELGVSPSNLCKYFHKHNIPIIRHSTSFPEKLIVDYFLAKGIKIIQHDRELISPREIDIYFPDHNLGVEVNGCYYHSEDFREKEDHLNKMLQCSDVGIQLLQFWDFEVLNKFEQVVSLIESKINNTTKIFARKTKVEEISSTTKKDFITKNHLQGDIPSSTNLGLFYNGDLVMVATFGKSRFTKNKTELLRLCSANGKQVVGGASKLITHFINSYLNEGDELISYCNRRYSTGVTYLKCGFKLECTSEPGFFYVTKSGVFSGTRYQWQKHLLKKKLPNYTESKTAFENMYSHGYRKVWDCGQFVFSLKK